MSCGLSQAVRILRENFMIHGIKRILFILVFAVNTQVAIYALDPVVVYAHGLGENAKLCKGILVSEIFPELDLYGHTGPEALVTRFGIDKLCFGQEGDIKQVIAACEEVLKKNSVTEIIAFGVSKGAATWLNTLGYLSKSSDKNHKKILDRIKVAVVISPFADLFEKEILSGLLGPFGPLAQRCVFPDSLGINRKFTKHTVKLILPAYDAEGIHPITSVQNIIPTIPIFIAHSYSDGLIPINHSRMIYCALIKNSERDKNKNTYLLEFEGGGHCDSIYNLHHSGSPMLWHQPMYDFLTKYGLMQSSNRAQSDGDLSSLQPSVAQIEDRIFKKSTVPSIACGVVLAGACEVGNYLYHKSKSEAYCSTWKRSCLCGLGLALGMELVHLLRKT